MASIILNSGFDFRNYNQLTGSIWRYIVGKRICLFLYEQREGGGRVELLDYNSLGRREFMVLFRPSVSNVPSPPTWCSITALSHLLISSGDLICYECNLLPLNLHFTTTTEKCPNVTVNPKNMQVELFNISNSRSALLLPFNHPGGMSPKLKDCVSFIMSLSMFLWPEWKSIISIM